MTVGHYAVLGVKSSPMEPRKHAFQHKLLESLQQYFISFMANDLMHPASPQSRQEFTHIYTGLNSAKSVNITQMVTE